MLIRTFGVSLLMLALAACSSVENPVIEYTTQGGVGEFAIGVQHDMYASTFANELGTTDRVFFAFDSAVLDEQAEASVRLWADLLAAYPEVVVVVEGHCDERGGREYNLALGERRADAVKVFLVELGIDPSRIATISYGKERPALRGHDEAAWSQNRRALLVPG